MDIFEFWLRLLMVNGLNQGRLRQVSSRITAQTIRSESIFHLLGFDTIQRKSFQQVNEKFLSFAIDWLSLPNNKLISYADNSYPDLLRHIKNPPLVLFVTGDVRLLNKTQLAIVGRRNNSHYGEQWGYHFAFELSAMGLVITSGLALGIDSICHKAALDAGGLTIAVLGSGLARITPRSHQNLAEQIVLNNGALVSEYLPGAPAIPQNFPKRNRIISGLSKGVLIVEAEKPSGSLITARCALEQGREVFALPGPLGNTGYNGTHWLIQQGANLVVTPSEIIEYLNSSLHWISDIDLMSEEPKNEEIVQLELLDDKILSAVSDEITTLDTIVLRVKLPITEVLPRLLELELMGYITPIEGGYIRLRVPATVSK